MQQLRSGMRSQCVEDCSLESLGFAFHPYFLLDSCIGEAENACEFASPKSSSLVRKCSTL